MIISYSSFSKTNDSFEASPYSRTRRPSCDSSLGGIDALAINNSSLVDSIVSLPTSGSSSVIPNQSEDSNQLTESSDQSGVSNQLTGNVDQPEESNQLTRNVDQPEESNTNQLSESNEGQSESGIIVARKSRPVLVSE